MDEFKKITEETSPYRHLEKMSIGELLRSINKEDQTVPFAVEKVIPQIKKLVGAISDKMLAGGRLFYIGAGTSGRLAVVDASECPPTYGVPYGLVIAVIAGGEKAITQAVENAEDDGLQGWAIWRRIKSLIKMWSLALRPAALHRMLSVPWKKQKRGVLSPAVSPTIQGHL